MTSKIFVIKQRYDSRITGPKENLAGFLGERAHSVLGQRTGKKEVCSKRPNTKRKHTEGTSGILCIGSTAWLVECRVRWGEISYFRLFVFPNVH
jgi:hypothetical protein